MLTVQQEAKRLEEWDNTPDIIELLKVVKNGNILEIGCGTGRIIHDLGKTLTESHFTGIDIQPYFIQLAQNKNIPHTKFIVADALDDEFPSQSFDYVIFRDVLHQINDNTGYSGVQKALENAYSYLRYGGTLVIRDGISSSKMMVKVWMEQRFIDLFYVYMENSVEEVSSSRFSEGFVMDVGDLVSFLGKMEKLRLNPGFVVKRGSWFSLEMYEEVLSRIGFKENLVQLYRYSSHLIPDGIKVGSSLLPNTYCMLAYTK